MSRLKINRWIGLLLLVASCKVPAIISMDENKPAPASYNNNGDTTNSSTIEWRKFFTDQNLVSLIDTALKNNQELLITTQEIEMAKNDIRYRHSSLLPTVGVKAGAGIEKVGRYTSQGAGDATTEIKPGQEFPDPLPDFTIAAYANWEVDIWNKLHNAKKAAVTRYLSSVEGRNFAMTNLIAEVANSYYELRS